MKETTVSDLSILWIFKLVKWSGILHCH